MTTTIVITYVQVVALETVLVAVEDLNVLSANQKLPIFSVVDERKKVQIPVVLASLMTMCSRNLLEDLGDLLSFKMRVIVTQWTIFL